MYFFNFKKVTYCVCVLLMAASFTATVWYNQAKGI